MVPADVIAKPGEWGIVMNFPQATQRDALKRQSGLRAGITATHLFNVPYITGREPKTLAPFWTSGYLLRRYRRWSACRLRQHSHAKRLKGDRSFCLVTDATTFGEGQ